MPVNFRRKLGVKRSQFLLLPKIPDIAFIHQTHITELNQHWQTGLVRLRIMSVKQRDILIDRTWHVSAPTDESITVEKFVVCRAVLVDSDHLSVGQQRHCELIHSCHVSAKNERRAGDGPQAHERVLLVLCKMSSATHASHAKRQHVRIGKMAGPAKRSPVTEAGELFAQ